MARIFIDGFESGGSDLWNTIDGCTITASSPISGNYMLSLSNLGRIGKKIDSIKTELYIAFKIKMERGSAGPPIITFQDSNGTEIASLILSGTGQVNARRASNEIIATSTIVLQNESTYLFDIRYKPLNSNGIFTIKINGSQEINYSGDTTAGLENVQGFYFSYPTGSAAPGLYDDIIVDDANWIGNTKIQALVPTGAGATTGWTPSTGANYATVDEKPASDTDYVKTSSEQIDTYAMGNLTGSIASIKSVAVQSRNWREGNGAYDRGQHIVRPASTDRLATAKTTIFPITATSFQFIWELNPEDSAAWEEADVNGMEAGIKAVTA